MRIRTFQINFNVPATKGDDQNVKTGFIAEKVITPKELETPVVTGSVTQRLKKIKLSQRLN